ncbi:ComEA family DNA-binding protein [Desulforamulus ferrireducens]|uniref:Competence protein ComEA n=1 Tax=Desulforamulus ferrireducens TaxID=1833852 RepID=A0A1S6IYS7_9FIRM|nr:ComEA family DNA-binding protein [Desulforamulus ferrireducens]AQS59925.1 competence protein ComEA [Desulforamulus ferrireducens]
MFNLGRKEQYLLVLVAAILIFTAGYQLANQNDATVELVGAANLDASAGEEDLLVHVTGAVAKPGLYKLPPGSRVNDAIEQASALPEADLSNLNLAARLKDEQKIIVPSQIQPAVPSEAITPGSTVVVAPVPGAKATPGPAPTSGKVNINTASAAELDSLPGIGPALAERIIQYRQTNGLFQEPRDLLNVSGIGEKKFAELEHLITVY